MRPSRSSITVPLRLHPDENDQAVITREVEALRVEYRRLTGRLTFRRRRGFMYAAFLGLTLVVMLTVAVFVLSPSDWAFSEQTRFTQMVTLVALLAVAIPAAAYFARRYDRQRERVRLARTRRREILLRLVQLDGVAGSAVRRRRRRRRHSFIWHVKHPQPFSRPPLESMSGEELDEAAAALGQSFTEARAMRFFAWVHAALTGAVALIIAFTITLAGPAYLSDMLGGTPWGGSTGVDPLVFWLVLTMVLVVIGGIGSHRVSGLVRHVRAYEDRIASIERALWDVRSLARERREKV